MLQRTLRWLNIVLVLGTLLCYLSPMVDPQRFWPLAFGGLIYPLLIFPHFFFIVFWLSRRRWYALFSIITLLFGLGHLQSYLGWHSQKVAELSIMSFNVYGLHSSEQSTDLMEVSTVIGFLQQHQPDVLLLQEFTTTPRRQRHYLDAIEAHTDLDYVMVEGYKPLAILSRYPLQEVQIQYFQNGSNGFQVADLLVDDHRYRLFNLHLRSNRISGLADRVADSGDPRERSTWRDIRGMFRQYRNTTVGRSRQADLLADLLRDSPHPVILGGDFNDVPLSYTYGTLSRDLKDTFVQRGTGLGTTYRGNLPGLRIDYILVDQRFRVEASRRIDAPFSDHYAVLAGISPAKPQ